MGVPAVGVVRGVVGPFGEGLALEGVPAAQQQRVAQGAGLALQLKDVVIVDVGVVAHRRLDELPRAHLSSAQDCRGHRFADDRSGRRRVDEALADPGMARSAGIGRTAHERPDAQASVGAHARAQVLVGVAAEVRQFVDVEPVDLRALIAQLVGVLVVAVAKAHRRTVDQSKGVVRRAVRAQLRRNDALGDGDQVLFQFLIRPAK